MSQQRIIIGFAIGLLAFAFINLPSVDFWNAAEFQFLEIKSILKWSTGKNNFVVIKIPYSNNLKNHLDKILAQDFFSVILIYDSKKFPLKNKNDLSKIQIIDEQEIKNLNRDEHNHSYFIDPKFDKIHQYQAKQNPSKSNLALIFEDYPECQAQKIINYIKDKRVSYLPTINFWLLIFALILGLIYKTMFASYRLFFCSTLISTSLILGQIVYWIFNLHLGLLEFICLNFLIYFFSYWNLEEKVDIQDNSPRLVMPSQSISEFINEEPKVNYRETFDLLENNNIDLAMQIEEKTVTNLHIIYDKIIELEKSTNLSHKELLKINLVKHNIVELIDEIDTILFNLIPLKSEGEEGFINVLELLASKIYILSQGKIQINLMTEVPQLNIANQSKSNIYRIVQKVLELISRSNAVILKSETEILKIDFYIAIDSNEKLRFKIKYFALPINNRLCKDEIEEIQLRAGSGDKEIQIQFGNLGLLEIDQKIDNLIEIVISS